MTPPQTPPTPKQPSFDLKKWRRRAALIGFLLALVCKALPHDYQTLCKTIASVCAGGF